MWWNGTKEKSVKENNIKKFHSGNKRGHDKTMHRSAGKPHNRHRNKYGTVKVKIKPAANESMRRTIRKKVIDEIRRRNERKTTEAFLVY